MRSSTFIIFSLIIHILAVAAVALAPQHTIEPSGGEIEVSTGTPDTSAGEVTAAPTETTSEPAPAPAPPAPKVEKVKPVTAAPVVKKSTPKKAAVVAEKAPVIEKVEEAAELPVKEEVATVPDDKLDPVVEDIKEEPAATAAAAEVPAAAKEDAKTEAAAVDANPPSPEPAPETGAKNTSAQGAGEGDLGQGGATKEDAVAYTELKQNKGNKNPSYPLKARKEQRQGQVDLVYLVTKEGLVRDIQIAKSSGHDDLDKAAVSAVSKFKFVPSQEGWAYHPVIFALKGESAPLPGKLRTAGSDGAE